MRIANIDLKHIVDVNSFVPLFFSYIIMVIETNNPAQ